MMAEVLFNIAAFTIFFALIWWTALVVLAIKGLLFHRAPKSPPQDAAAAEEFSEAVPVMPKGCLWAIVFAFWPMAVASAIDEWLTARAHRGSESGK